jgi:predicted nucleic acid-binding protein
MTACLDTGVFLQIFGRKQPFHPILRALLDGRFILAVSTEILLEYQEVTTRLSGTKRWRDMAALLDLLAQLHGNIRHVEPKLLPKQISWSQRTMISMP